MEMTVQFISPRLCFGPVALTGAAGRGIARGITAVCGPNGSGKTTLGCVIERGRYGFGNRVDFARPGMTVKMLAFTDIHSFTGVDVLRYDQRLESSENEYVPTVGQIFGTALHSGLYRSLSSRLGLDGAEAKRINYLSSGELRKLLIINALLSQPDILVLDNPFIGLDAPSRCELSSALESLRQRGVNVVMLLSDPADIPAFTDHTLWLKDCTFADSRAEAFADHGSDGTHLQLPPAPAPVPIHTVAFSIADGHAGYGGRDIFSHLDWHVARGDRWLLTGPNGSGKSLLLSMICGDNPQAYANDIVILDRKRGSGESIWDIKNNVGYVCPEMQLYFRSRHDVTGIVAEGMRPVLERYRPYTDAERGIARQWLALMGIGHLGDRQFDTLSSAQQKLVLLARALAPQPALLVLDEPFQGLDPQMRQRVRAVVDAVTAARRSTLIFVTHYPGEISGCRLMHMPARR